MTTKLEFVDLYWDFLREHDVPCHINPHWRTPSLWEQADANEQRARLGSPSIDFGPDAKLRSLQIGGLEPMNSILLYYHPVMERVYMKFYLPKIRKKGLKKKAYIYERGGYFWEVFDIHDPNALYNILDRIESIDRVREQARRI